MKLLGNRGSPLVLLLATALWFFWIGRKSFPADFAFGLGSLLLGAFWTYLLTTFQEKRKAIEAAAEARGRDLDETRRLAYMALVAPKTNHPDLVATVGNALAHHRSLLIPFEESAVHLAAFLDRGEYESEQWLRNLIYRITNELGDNPDQ